MKTKVALALAFVALAVQANAQHLDKKVTFEEPAGAADHVLAALSKAAGVRLAADSEMAREVILISVHDASLKELLDRISKVTSGRWATDQGGWCLVPDRRVRDAETNTELKAKTNALRKLIEGPSATPTPNRPNARPPNDSGDEPENEHDKFADLTCLHGLTRILVNRIGSTAISEIGAEERLVYSSNPSTGQLPLPALTEQEVSAFVSQHNAALEQFRRESQLPVEERHQTDESIEALGVSDEGPLRIITQPFKILLAIECRSEYNFDLLFYDRDGKVTFHSYQCLYSPEFEIANEIGAGRQGQPSASAKKVDKPIALGPVSLELLSLLNKGPEKSGKRLKMSDGLLQKLLHPERFDPLSYFPTDGLLALARNRHEQLVADLPDSVAGEFEGMTDSEYLSWIRSDGQTVAREESGWMQISPLEPSVARTKRLDRYALMEFVDASYSKGTPSLDDIAKYALRAEEPAINGAEHMYLSHFMPGTNKKGFMDEADWNTIRFYGLLDATQKELLRAGNSLPIHGLSAEQFALVRQMVYGAGVSLEVRRSGNRPKRSLFETLEIWGPEPEYQKDYLGEPTESLAGGIPPVSTVQMGVSNETVIKPELKDAGWLDESGVWGVNSYALYQSVFELASSTGRSQEIPRLDRLQVGRRATYTFTFRFTPLITVTKKLRFDDFPADPPFVGVADLPQEFLDAVKSKVEEIKKAPDYIKALKEAGTSPPPGPPRER